MPLLFAALLTVAPTEAAASPPVKEKKICRSEEVTGSVFSKHVCHTKAEWSEIDVANQRNSDRFQNDRRSNSSQN